MQPAIAQHFGSGLGIAKVLGEQALALNEQLAVLFGDAQFHAGQRLADAAGLGLVERVQRHHAAFRQPVTLHQRHADRLVEFGEFLAKRRGAGSRNRQASAQACPHLLKEQPVGNL